MGRVGCYTLHLYCDNDANCPDKWDRPQGEFTGRTEAECLRDAMQVGWKIDKKREGKEGEGGAFVHAVPERKKMGLTEEQKEELSKWFDEQPGGVKRSIINHAGKMIVERVRKEYNTNDEAADFGERMFHEAVQAARLKTV